MESSGKSVLRDRVRELVRAVSTDERRALSQRLCGVALRDNYWRSAGSSLFFAPLPDEPDITPLLHEAWRTRRLVALPRFDAGTNGYAACVVSSRAELTTGRYGVMEPSPACPLIPLNQLDFAFVPGVAFDLDGRRLGRGKGFYDRLLAGVRGHKCGVALDAQIVTEVPEESHDVRVDSILTPTRWHWCGTAG